MHNSYGNSSRTLIENDDVDLPIPIQQTRSINNETTSIMNSSTSASSSDNQILSGIECLGTAAFFHEALQNNFQTFNFSQCPPNALPVLYETLFNYLNSCSSPPQIISTNSDAVVNINNETTTAADLFVPTSNLSQNCFVPSNPVNSYVSQTELNKNYNFYQPTPTRFFTPYASKNVMSNMVDAVLAHEQEQQNLRLPNLLPTNILQTPNAIQKFSDREKFQSKSSMKPIYLGSYSMPVCSSSNDVSPPTPSTVSIPDVNILSFYDEDTCEEYTTDDDEENAGTSDETNDFICVDYSKNVSAFSGVGIPADIEGIKRRYRLDRKIENLTRRDRRRMEKSHYTSVFKRKEKNKSFKKTTAKNFSSNDECDASSTFAEIKIQDKCFPVNRRFHFKSRSNSNTVLDLVGLHFANLQFPSLPMLRHDGPNVKIFKKLKRKFRMQGKLQSHLCHDLPGVSLCLECFESRHTANDTDYCRFMDFRHLRQRLRKVDNCLVVAGFITYNNKKSSSCNNLHKEFLPPVSSMKTWSLETAVYVLSNINRQFKFLLNREKIFLSDCLRWNFVGNFNEPLPWRDAFNVRELCDVCSTTIFNLHLICNNCALAVCIDCVYARIRREPRCEIPSPYQDNFGWTFCSTKQKRQHCPTDLRLAQLIPDENSAILLTLESLNDRVFEQIERYKLTNQVEFNFSRNKFTYEPPTSTHRYMFQGAILVLKESKNAENLFLFQKHWKNATPVLVENVTQGLNLSIWQPSVMKMKCEGRASSGSIVDCRTGSVIDNLDASSFWDGFIDCHRRVTGYDNRKLYLKLKDWPPAEKFSNVLPEHYADLCDSLPIPEYTHPRRGAFNLATNLPLFCVEPDLGPKMYTAYEMIFEPTRGTTNLHLDISCAVNILVSVTTPLNINTNYLYKSVLEHLEGQGLDPEDFERAKRNPDKVGALWTIFRPEDSEAIRSFLFELAEEQRKNDFDDPIHDQMCYLHVQLRQRLEQERGVKGFTFVQMLGDAVFIPAGAAHQVQNMLCCIKVAEDFVSPEGVSRCAAVAGEFRNLTKQHSNHEDKLQLPNIVLHSVREAVRTLELNEPTLFCK